MKTRFGNKLSFYDNGGKSLDRITIVFNNKLDVRHPIKKQGRFKVYDCISASETGKGIFTWSDCIKGKHLGKKVNFESLTPELQDNIVYVTESMSHY